MDEIVSNGESDADLDRGNFPYCIVCDVFLMVQFECEVGHAISSRTKFGNLCNWVEGE